MQTDAQGNASTEIATGLAEEVIRTFGEVRLRVSGTSMAPAILPGDLVAIRRAGFNEITPGDVVAFVRNGRLIAHRVVSKNADSTGGNSGDYRFVTRGDRTLHDDPPVTQGEMLGRVVSVERGHRKVEIAARTSEGPLGRLLRASNRATGLYVRVLAAWRSIFFRGAKCRV